MTTQAPDDMSQRREEWVRRVNDLTSDVERWALAEGWSAHRHTTRLKERLLGDYTVPTLQIRMPGGELYLKPVALHVVGGDGRVDLEAWPTLNRVKLVGRGGGWQIITDSNVPLHEEWGRDAFVRVANDLQA
jgi:hypothetical protein